MEEDLKNIVYSRDSIEFVTVALQYCAFLENIEDGLTSNELQDKLTKILPLLYLKASLVPETEQVNEESPEITVSEELYNYMLSRLSSVFGSDDTYLEVFVEDMKYSDTPISASISEDLTDIYQDTKNFVSVYEHGVTENMNDAMYVCIENFKIYWGQKLVNVLRALHSLKYGQINNDLGDEEEHDNMEEIW